MRLILLVLFAIVLTLNAHAQYNPLLPPNSYASSDNPNYWKNKKPHSAYWQQDVYYNIKAKLDDEKDVISGLMHLEYVNNSPDTLSQLVFHLYQNAFSKGSYASDFFSLIPDQSDTLFQKTEVFDVTVNDMSVKVVLDNTILFIKLTAPLLPGETTKVDCTFETQFGKINGRMKMYNAWGFKHYNVVHWYPRIAVYDHKFGWTTDQHLGSEFYGDFGAFDVELDLPEQYILDGTGNLLNRSEVLPDELMKQLSISNYADKPWNDKPSEIIAPSSKRKLWKFHAENVHDFAWTADPTYRIGVQETTLKSGHKVTCYALAQEPHAARWQNAAAYAAQVIEMYSNDFGEYVYHKMIVADARDGMEYPMLTLDGGGDPGYRSLLAHEIGHNWFFGMVGNNETYRASLDEGFTQFLTSWSITALEGDSASYSPHGAFLNKFYNEDQSVRDQEVYNGFYYSSVLQGESPRLNTHSDQFKAPYLYGQVYSKTATMLYNLQYVLGDELFLNAMRNYFEQWKFCHPYFEDFRESIIHYTKVDLNWFFDQWLETEETIDYKVRSFKRKGDKYILSLTRKGMQMPLDIRLIDREGEAYDYHIPNTYFQKKSEATVLPKWYGWNEFNKNYTTEISLDADIEKVLIDPSGRLADVYQLDNSSKTPLSFELNDFARNRFEKDYILEWNPTVRYNGYDGLKLGLFFKGNYMETYHDLEVQLWLNTGLLQQSNEFQLADQDAFNLFNYRFKYSDPLRGISRDLSYTYEFKWIEGLLANDFYFQKDLPNDKTSIKAGLEGLYRPRTTDLNYLIYPAFWNADQWNNFTKVELEHRYSYGRSNGRIESELRSPFFLSDYDYGFINLDVVNDNRFSVFNWRTRVFGQFGQGRNWAPESQLFAAGANPEQMMDNPLTRSMGYAPEGIYDISNTTGQFQVGGGLNLRGYNNYLMPQLNGDSLLRLSYVGHTGLAFNTELEFDDLIRIAKKGKRFVELKTYLFADAGIINVNRPAEALEFSNIRMDAGAGATLEIKRWASFTDLKPLTVRLDLPLFLNRPPASEEYIAFRWLIGFERAF